MRHEARAAGKFLRRIFKSSETVNLLSEFLRIVGIKRASDCGKAKHNRSGKSAGLGGFAFDLKSFFAFRIEEHGNFVTVLIAALINDLEHLGGSVRSERESLDGHVISLSANGDLRDGSVDDRTFEFWELRSVRLYSGHDNGNSSFDHRNGYRGWDLGVSGGDSRKSKSRGQRATKQGELCDEFHSGSSVAMRSDFRKRISCGVMANLATARRSRSGSWKES